MAVVEYVVTSLDVTVVVAAVAAVAAEALAAMVVAVALVVWADGTVASVF